jgi:hypothetical protein
MPRSKPASSTRARRNLIAIVAVPVLAAGAIWLGLAARNESPAMPPASQAVTPTSRPTAAVRPTPYAAPGRRGAASTPAKPAASASDTFAPGAAGQQVHIDPKTGRIREREHDDAPAAAQIAPRRLGRTATLQSEPAAQPVLGPGGAVGMAVPEELQTFMVARRTADGRLVLEHATGPKGSNDKVRKGAAKTSGVKEERDDR